MATQQLTEEIALSQIVPDPLNPRERIDFDHAEGLADRFTTQGFLPVGTITLIERDAADWWKDYEISQRRNDARWKESVNINFVPRTGKLLQIVAGEHRYHGAIMAKLPKVLGTRFHGTLAEARIMQAAENTGKAWTEKELLIMVKKAVDAGQSFDEIKRFTGKRANWIEARIEAAALPLQVLEMIGSYAGAGEMRAMANLYNLVGKSQIFPDRHAVDLVIRDIATRWMDQEHPSGWLIPQVQQWEQDAQQSFMFGSPVPNERDLEEKEFGTLLVRYRRQVADLSDALQTYLHGWKTSHPDASLADFVHAAASRKHTRVGQLLDSFRVADVQTRKLISLLCLEGDEEAACKMLKAADTCDAAPGTCTAAPMRQPSKHMPEIAEGDSPEEIAEKLTTGILNAWKSGDLVPSIAKIWIGQRSDKPSNHWSFGNLILMYLQGTSDARGVMQWHKAKRVVRTGAKPIYIWGPWNPDGSEVSSSNPPKAYFPIEVFAYEDTIGEPLPESADGAPARQLPPLLDVAAKIKVPVTYAPPSSTAGGYYQPSTRQIVLHQEQWGVFFHELSHAVDHYLGQYPMIGKRRGAEGEKQYARGEVVAETCAACLLALYGQDPDKGSRSYVEGWATVEKYQDPVTAVRALLGRVINVLTFILTCGSHPDTQCPPNIVKKLEQKQRKAKRGEACKERKAAGKSCRAPRRRDPAGKLMACPRDAKRLTLEIGQDKLTNVCVTRVEPGREWAGWRADDKGELYRLDWASAEGHLTINHTRSVSKIVDSQGRQWGGSWKVVQGQNGRIGLIKEA